MSGSARKALSDVQSGRKALTNARKRLGGPPKCSGVVEMPSRMSGSGWEAFPIVRE